MTDCIIVREHITLDDGNDFYRKYLMLHDQLHKSFIKWLRSNHMKLMTQFIEFKEDCQTMSGYYYIDSKRLSYIPPNKSSCLTLNRRELLSVNIVKTFDLYVDLKTY